MEPLEELRRIVGEILPDQLKNGCPVAGGTVGGAEFLMLMVVIVRVFGYRGERV
jgi:hypothetical protein